MWENMLAVCDGNSTSDEQTKPKSARLHCDAYKNVQIRTKRLPEQCDGWLLNPLHLPTENLFTLELATGKLGADAAACTRHAIPGNNYASTQELVEKTIEHLNLNATRLCELRRKTLFAVNDMKKLLQKHERRRDELEATLARRFLSKPWRPFFTTYRCVLGTAAEKHLQALDYQG